MRLSGRLSGIAALAVAIHLCLALAVARPATAAAPGTTGAAAGPSGWSPLRVAVECQRFGRVRACPFLRGFVDATPLLAAVPRSDAQVVLYVNVTDRANDDMVALRFTSALSGMPDSYELTQAVDSRAADDAQRSQLEPAFRRGIAVYLALLNPAAVKVELEVPADSTRVAPPTTPWGFWTEGGGNGSWTDSFRSISTWAGAGVSRVTTQDKLSLSLATSYSLTQQPPLVIDGQKVSLDYDSYDVTGSMLWEHHLDDDWSIGAIARGGHQDAEGQFLATGKLHAGISRDWYPSGDPRGNVLSLSYIAGAQADRYNTTNVLGEDRAIFASHGLIASGSVRKDTTSYYLDLVAASQLDDPARRHVVSANARVSVAVGDHVDITLSAGVTRQAIPGPRSLDTANIEEVTRASYAEPLRLSTFLNLSLHWDSTNSARNNRFSAPGNASPLGNL